MSGGARGVQVSLALLRDASVGSGRRVHYCVQAGLRIHRWVEGSIEDVLTDHGLVEHEGALWCPCGGEEIEVIQQAPCTFRVEA